MRDWSKTCLATVLIRSILRWKNCTRAEALGQSLVNHFTIDHKHRYQRQLIYHWISYMSFGFRNADKSMTTPMDQSPLHCCGIVTSRKQLLWRNFGRLSWECFQVGHVRSPTVVKLIITLYVSRVIHIVFTGWHVKIYDCSVNPMKLVHVWTIFVGIRRLDIHVLYVLEFSMLPFWYFLQTDIISWYIVAAIWV